ncbi:hypothetical protein AVEN_93519-1 [Araneus ventricosus]|uniref:Uncharacterized protein n=1 Tax=Araneus ventricosus TaxID=182803 RepID=A0A4Y2APK6_ARAVE|nr:hypothetical protein AVEN_93519-1 [Araneus ventricosus]
MPETVSPTEIHQLKVRFASCLNSHTSRMSLTTSPELATLTNECSYQLEGSVAYVAIDLHRLHSDRFHLNLSPTLSIKLRITPVPAHPLSKPAATSQQLDDVLPRRIKSVPDLPEQ